LKEEKLSMTEKRVILVTGVAGYWGSRLAARLVDEAGYHIIGLDAEPPAEGLNGLDFIRADVRNPLLADLLKSEGVDTICHLAFVGTTRPSEAAFDLNVMGTTKVLGACAEAGVRKVVLKSSTAVYGARPSNSAFLTEEHSLRGSKRYGYNRDRIEIENFCRGFRHRVPEVMVTILRFASIVGPTADTPMTCFLKEPYAPSLLGFDPMMQIIHEDDVVEALAHAVLRDVPGVFNVAAQDAWPLSKIRGLAGKSLRPLFHLFAYWGVSLVGGRASQLGRYVPLDLDYLRFPWVADLTHMGEDLGFEPHYTADETLREFAERHGADRHLLGPVSAAQDEERLRSVIEKRRHAREQWTTATSSAEQGGDHE
jgi:UDP-glucose 4-epimerase